MKSRTVAQARVGLDHTLSDIQLVVETIRKLGPGEQIGTGDSDTMEVGLNGSWEGGNK